MTAKHTTTILGSILDTFQKNDIPLFAGGVFEWDENRVKHEINAARKDHTPIEKHPEDNILKHRVQDTGVAVIDGDGIPFEMIHEWFPTTVKTFYTTTSSFAKGHFYIYPPVNKTFPESRAIKDLHPDLDIITYGTIFEGHDFQSPDSQFTMNNDKILRCTQEEYDTICEIMEPKKKTPKQNKFAGNKNPIIAKFNEKHSSKELLMAQGYLSIRDRLLRPDSTRKTAGIFFFDDGCVFSHGGDWLNDGSSHDSFDIYSHYEHDGDKSKAMSVAKELLNLNYDGFENCDEMIDYKRLRYIKSQIGYSNEKKMFYMVNSTGQLIPAGAKEFWDFAEKTYPPAFNYSLAQGDEDKAKIKSIKYKSMIDIKYYNSFEKLEYKIDPFSKENRVKCTGKIMRVATYNLFPNLDLDDIKVDYNHSKKVYKDFTKHFPEFSVILDTVIASRFGGDRKESFLYTQMVSNFGKSLLAKAFSELGLLVEINTDELKQIVKGGTVSINAAEFQTAWILFFDEFKQAPAELKNITHSMKVNAKFMLRQEVQLYFKWAASAEASQSLLGNGGVETQFAKRFSMINTGGSDITDRALYKQGRGKYLKALTYALYTVIKAKIKEYIALGEDEAENKAQEVITVFRGKYALKATLDNNVDELIDRMIHYAKKCAPDFDDTMGAHLDIVIVKDLSDRARQAFMMHNECLYVKNVSAMNTYYHEFLANEMGDQNSGKLEYKKDRLRNRFSKDQKDIGKGGFRVKAYPLLWETINPEINTEIDDDNDEIDDFL